MKKSILYRSFFAIVVIAMWVISMFPLKDGDYFKHIREVSESYLKKIELPDEEIKVLDKRIETTRETI